MLKFAEWLKENNQNQINPNVLSWALNRFKDEAKGYNFAKWFGNSKVVDSYGNPLVVYHGTAANFDAFDDSKTGRNDLGLWGKGHYFASSASTASSYALRQGWSLGDNAKVIPVFVSIQNPLVLKTGKDFIIRMPDGANSKELIGPNLDGSKIKSIALDKGHDGVIQLKIDGTIGDIVAYKSNQIKSATGNKGTFNPDSNNINESPVRSFKN